MHVNFMWNTLKESQFGIAVDRWARVCSVNRYVYVCCFLLVTTQNNWALVQSNKLLVLRITCKQTKEANQQQENCLTDFFPRSTIRISFRTSENDHFFLFAAHEFKIAFWWSGSWRAMDRQVGRKVRRTRCENVNRTGLIKVMGKMLHLASNIRVLTGSTTKICVPKEWLGHREAETGRSASTWKLENKLFARTRRDKHEISIWCLNAIKSTKNTSQVHEREWQAIHALDSHVRSNDCKIPVFNGKFLAIAMQPSLVSPARSTVNPSPWSACWMLMPLSATHACTSLTFNSCQLKFGSVAGTI